MSTIRSPVRARQEGTHERERGGEKKEGGPKSEGFSHRFTRAGEENKERKREEKKKEKKGWTGAHKAHILLRSVVPRNTRIRIDCRVCQEEKEKKKKGKGKRTWIELHGTRSPYIASLLQRGKKRS